MKNRSKSGFWRFISRVKTKPGSQRRIFVFTRLCLFLSGYKMVTTYNTKHKKPQNYAKNGSFIKLPILAKNGTISNLDRRFIKEKCRNLANFGISWMMQGSNLRPAD